MKEKIKDYFEKGNWTVEMVRNAVKKGKITELEFEEITGFPYNGAGK